LSSCNHYPEAQTTLVSEVKAALARALALPEASLKHTKVQVGDSFLLNSIFVANDIVF
jgi:E3 ubiquitin-protein ligase HUWE1